MRISIKSLANKLIVLGLACATLGTLPACTNEEVVAGFAGAALGATAMAIATGPRYYEPMPTCRTSRRQVCSTYRDFWGNYQRQCEVETRRGCSALGDDSSISGIEPQDLALTFKMSFDSAKMFLASLDSAKSSGSPEAIIALGLTSGDVEKMANFQMISDESVQRVSKKLNQAPADTAAMIQKLIEAAREQDKINNPARYQHQQHDT